MLKLLAHPLYAWFGLVGAKVSVLIGLASAVTDRKILNMDADDWFQLSALYMLFIIAALLAQAAARLERKEEA
jgi:hypothetical protein